MLNIRGEKSYFILRREINGWIDRGEEIMSMMLFPLEISHIISFCDSTYLVGQN